MSLRTRRHTKNTQSQVGLNTSNPLARGLADFIYAGQMHSLKRTMFGNSTITGVYSYKDNDLSVRTTSNIPIPNATEWASPPCTMVAKVYIADLNSSSSFSCFLSTGAGDTRSFVISAYNFQVTYQRNYTGPAGVTVAGSVAPVAGNTYTLVWRMRSDTDHIFEVWDDQGNYNSATDTTDTSSVTFIDWGDLILGNQDAGSGGYEYYVHGGGFWDRALSDAEVLSLKNDFYQLLDPRRRHLFDAAGVTETINLATLAYTSNNFNAAQQQQIPADTLAYTENDFNINAEYIQTDSAAALSYTGLDFVASGAFVEEVTAGSETFSAQSVNVNAVINEAIDATSLAYTEQSFLLNEAYLIEAGTLYYYPQNFSYTGQDEGGSWYDRVAGRSFGTHVLGYNVFNSRNN